jgi:hypothetical protein
LPLLAPFCLPPTKPAYTIQERSIRTVSRDCLVAFETNRYSVPHRRVGRQVEVQAAGDLIRILHSRGKAFLAAGLVIVDEVGYLPVDSRSAHLFFQFISYRYEGSSTILTLNKSLIDWQELFGDAV